MADLFTETQRIRSQHYKQETKLYYSVQYYEYKTKQYGSSKGVSHDKTMVLLLVVCCDGAEALVALMKIEGWL
jgi:hypothetical protein